MWPFGHIGRSGRSPRAPKGRAPEAPEGRLGPPPRSGGGGSALALFPVSALLFHILAAPHSLAAFTAASATAFATLLSVAEGII